MSIRYYLHGDQELYEDMYYCAFCDLFCDTNHFYNQIHKDSNHLDRYNHSLQAFENLKKNYLGRYDRPEATNNLFSHLPKELKPTKSRFYRWLMQQLDRDEPIGDLANDIKRDSSYPIATDSIKIIKAYLISQGACDQALQALEESWEEFKSNTPARFSLSPKIRFEVLKSNNYRCQICGASASDSVKLEVDHKVPVAKGGTDEMENLWTLCFTCNRGKGASDL